MASKWQETEKGIKKVQTYKLMLMVPALLLASSCGRSEQASIQSTQPQQELSADISVPAAAKPTRVKEQAAKSDSTQAEIAKAAKPNFPENVEFKTIDWVELMPEKDLEALSNPPEYVSEVEDGSFEDQLSSQIKGAMYQANDDAYQQALISTDIVPDMNDKFIRLPGFIVPVEFSSETLTVTQFFLVPYFGACIHLPPPPPNQIILVDYPQGFKVERLDTAFWISGQLKTDLVMNDMATAAYSMTMHSFEPY